MIFDAPNRNHLWGNLIIEECVRCGVGLFCIAPGSRSTPLTTAVARHPHARHLVHFDERGTAFAALGYARATGRPAAWITTSGTALANGMPAVIEASVDQVPLLLLTADRPPELRQTGANQTIDQVKLYGDAVRWFFDMPVPDAAVDPAMVLTTIDQAIYRTLRSPKGPVHLNCMFREPLAPLAIEEAFTPKTPTVKRWYQAEQPYTRYAQPQVGIEETELERLAERLQEAKRGLLVVGKLTSMREAEAVRHLGDALGWPWLPDIGSYLRLGHDASDSQITYYDHVLGRPGWEEHRPDVVLHIGGRATSKRLLQYVQRAQPEAYIVVRDGPTRFDPTHQVTDTIEAAIGPLARRLAENVQALARFASTEWLNMWRSASHQVNTHIEDVLAEEEGLSEPAVARLISAHLPKDTGLFLGSSMPIRDMDMFAVATGAAVPVAANRGASGIDGTVATAVGYAQGLERLVTMLLGDLALLHDLNSLAMLRDAPYPVVIVVINNDGGGIFSFLPIAEYPDVFESYFGTPHGYTFAQAARMFEVAYSQPKTKAAFREAYQQAMQSGASALIEVRTERTANKALHDRLLQC